MDKKYETFFNVKIISSSKKSKNGNLILSGNLYKGILRSGNKLKPSKINFLTTTQALPATKLDGSSRYSTKSGGIHTKNYKKTKSKAVGFYLNSIANGSRVKTFKLSL